MRRCMKSKVIRNVIYKEEEIKNERKRRRREIIKTINTDQILKGKCNERKWKKCRRKYDIQRKKNESKRKIDWRR